MALYANSTALPPIKTIEIPTAVRTFTYQVFRDGAGVCIQAQHTGAVRKFAAAETLWRWLDGLRQHLEDKYGADECSIPGCFEEAIVRHPLNDSQLCADHMDEALDALDDLHRDHQQHIRETRMVGVPW